MADIRTSSMGGVPKGTTSDRPANPSIGDVFYNGTLGCLDIYTAQGWVANSAPPAIPTIGTATYSATNKAYNNSSASVTFTPGEGGGLPNSYRATSNPGGFTGTASSSPITVSGLQSGVAYTFSVTGTNNFGTSAASISSNLITANTVPQAPTIGTASTNTETTDVVVTWTNNSNGGDSITSIKVRAYSGSTIVSTTTASTNSSTSATITGLTSGNTYTFKVFSTNLNGDSLESNASNSVTIPTFIPVEYLVLAGGGGGGTPANTSDTGGGGGAGGYRTGSSFTVMSGQSYTCTVGAGGSGRTVASGQVGGSGSNSTFSTITSAGGGGGGGNTSGIAGGSGGGAGGYTGSAWVGGAGNTPATSPSQGNNGGSNVNTPNYGSGGGGGAGSAGINGTTSSNGGGGSGIANSITGSSITYGGGGGGGAFSSNPTPGSGGSGGGGTGGSPSSAAVAGTANLGGGGGGQGSNQNSASGGSGVIIIKAPVSAASTTGSPTITTSGGYNIYKFTANGSITF